MLHGPEAECTPPRVLHHLCFTRLSHVQLQRPGFRCKEKVGSHLALAARQSYMSVPLFTKRHHSTKSTKIRRSKKTEASHLWEHKCIWCYFCFVTFSFLFHFILFKEDGSDALKWEKPEDTYSLDLKDSLFPASITFHDKLFPRDTTRCMSFSHLRSRTTLEHLKCSLSVHIGMREKRVHKTCGKQVEHLNRSLLISRVFMDCMARLVRRIGKTAILLRQPCVEFNLRYEFEERIYKGI